MKTIYKTIGAAKEYCELAVDIYENCPHNCDYCYVKNKYERKNKEFKYNGVRENILEETEIFLKENIDICNKTIFLGFSSDPFPTGYDVSATLKMIKLLKKYGCKIMLCTKSGLYNETIKESIKLTDSVGITISCGEKMAKKHEKNAASISERLELLKYAKSCGCETWISFEPVLEPNYILNLLDSKIMNYVDIVKLGKLNHMEISDLTNNKNDVINWTEYGNKAIEICKKNNINFVVKEALKKLL